MGEDASRDSMLARVHRAVAGWSVDGPTYRWPAETLSPAALVDRFVARAEDVQAFVSVAADFVGALQRTTDIVSELAAQQVIVSDSAWESPWDIRKLSDVVEECTIRSTSSLNDASVGAIARFAYVGITTASYALADTGTIVLCSSPDDGRVESLLPPVHIALLRASQIVATQADLMTLLHRDGRMTESNAVTFITGPSRTADIELTLTLGVHGPKQLYIVIVNDVHR